MVSKLDLAKLDNLIDTIDTFKDELTKIANSLPTEKDIEKTASVDVEYLDNTQVLNFAKAFLVGRI